MTDKKKQDTSFINLVRSYLLEKGFRPGDQIEAEVSLANRFNVTRYKMRTALTALTDIGILERTRGRGTIIKNFDVSALSEQIKFQFELSHFDITEFKEARVIVERAIMPLVLRRINPQQITKLEETIQLMRNNSSNPRIADKSDRDFHLLLFNSSGNEVLNAFSGVISTLFHSEGYRHKYWKAEKIERLAKEHELILEAVKIGDVELAINRLDDHLGYKNLGVLTY